MSVEPIRWHDNELQLLDQRKLPREVIWVRCRDAHEVAVAIRDMVVRGAPAIRVAAESGKRIAVFADETRPYLQGARLTAWELQQDGIDVTLITDNMAGHFFQQGRFDAVIVGADRIAANGDAANKIGTYTVAVLAKAHGVPFYIAAPISTIDIATPNGAAIPIEERSADEVTSIGGMSIAPDGIAVRHPAFDVTPAPLITAIITDRGVLRPPYEEAIRKALAG